MSGGRLHGQRVLIVEDEYFQAMDAKAWLERAGAEVVGPTAFADEVAQLIDEKKVDAAMVDINLGLGANFAVANRLREKDIPFLFLTGYDGGGIPAALNKVPRVIKPANEREVLRQVAKLIG